MSVTFAPYSIFYSFLMSKTRQKSRKNNAVAAQIKPKLTQQQILLDKNGYIIESNDTIFSTTSLRHRPIAEWSTFLSSFFDQVKNMRLDSPEIVVNRVETITDFMSEKLFDCSFMRVEWDDSDAVFVWSIFDYPTDWLKSLRLQQQIFNNHSLAQEPKITK